MLSNNFLLSSLLALLSATLCQAGTIPQTASSSAPTVRDMVTDRPDTTESPITVPAGMFQVEMSFFDYSRDGDAGVREEDWIFGQINLKAGLAQDLDLQVIFDSYQQVKTSGGGASQRLSGFGDVTVRLKKNLWGNDGGRSAGGLIPYVSVPTGTEVSADVWGGGLIVPVSYSITDRVSIGVMGQVDIAHDEETNGQDLEWIHSASLGIGLTEDLGMYLELVGIAGNDTNYQALFDTGLTLAVTDNLMFDVGVRIGLNRPAPDFGVFSGMSFRF